MKKAAQASKRLLLPGFALLGGVLSTYLTLADISLDTKLFFVGACGLVIVTSIAWPAVKGLKLRALNTAIIAAVALAAAWAQSFIINADTIRIDYRRTPSAQETTGGFLVRAGRTPETFVLDCYVQQQATPIAGFSHQVGPNGTPANIQVVSLTQYDRQVTFTSFVEPQFARLAYTLSAPAIVGVDLVSPVVATVLFREELTWYEWAVRLYGVVLFAGGALLAWRRSS